MRKKQASSALPEAVPLAIVGIGCLFPGARDAQSYWTNIRNGVDAITEIPETHWRVQDYFDDDPNAPDMTYARRGGFIDPLDFEPLLYGLSPNNIEATDTTQLLGMVVARQALLDAGYATGKDSGDGRPFDRARTSVILGVTGTLKLVIPLGARLGHPLWRKALAEAGVEQAVADDVVQRIADAYVPWQENSFPGLLGNVAAGRIANRFDLGGTNCVVDAACASSLSAIHMAALELYSGRSDMALTGGLDTFNDIFMYMCFSKTPALSPTGNSRPFDRNGDGTILGEGLGIVILKRLADAKRDGDKVYAVIKGIGSSSDGQGNAIYAPSAEGQTRALKNAYKEARAAPGSIELVEAHGTGTSVGDAVEAEALSGVYREDRAQGSWCAIGSVKSMIGHTKAAAGVAGLIKVALALKNKVLPPTLKVEQPLESLQAGNAPVYVNASKRPWIGERLQARRAALSAFGFGGSNFHCVLEEAEAIKPQVEWDGQVLLFCLAADSANALQKQLQAMAGGQGWAQLRAAAARSRQTFDAQQPHRLVLVVDHASDLTRLLSSAAQSLQQDAPSWETPDGAYYSSASQTGKLAVLFPGQGSQYCQMLLDLACQFPQMQQALIHADALFVESSEGLRLSDLMYPVAGFTAEARRLDEDKLRATQHAQPAIAASSLGAWQVLQHFGVRADAIAGHSFGELTALCAAARIDEHDLYKLAMKRGELMQASAGEHGAMLAVSASAAVVHEFLEAERLDLIIANNNAPRQVVLSGARAQIEQAIPLLDKRGLRARQLSVAAAFHSSFVADAERPFAEFLHGIEFHQGDVDVFANSSTKAYPRNPDAAKKLLAGQLARPVEFVAQIENMSAAGCRTFIEVGPGNTLTGLVRSILSGRAHWAVALDASKGKRGGQYDLACLLAQLAVQGHSVDVNAWDADCPEDEQGTADKKPLLSIPLGGANYVKQRPQRAPAPARASNTETNTMTKESASDKSVAAAGRGSADDHALLQASQQSILALQKMQEQTAKLHRQYLEGQEAAQQSIQLLIQQQQQLLSGAPLAPPSIPASAPAPAQASAVSTTPTVPQARPAAATPAKASPEYEGLLLEVVAEKTGYPVEMLSLDMHLDTDLGIDSIKRVEILSALQERLPGMQKIQPEDLGTFQLLKHIVEFLATDDGAMNVSAPTQARAVSTTPTVPQARPAAATPAKASPEYEGLLLEVVAEKTGYPVEMLSLDMHLDTDLGIDSIKRVEILSALQDRTLQAPTLNPEDLAELQTLQQIIEHMQGGDSQQTAAKAAPVPKAEASISRPALYRGVVEVLPLREDHAPVQINEHAPVYVTDDGSELAGKICQVLKRNNLQGRIISLNEKTIASASGLILLAPEDADDTFLQSAFTLVQTCSQALQRADKQRPAILAGITRLGGAFGIRALSSASVEAGGLSGLIKTADKEWPQVHCKAIDIPVNQDNTKLATTIVKQILQAGPLEVGITDEGACTLSLKSQAVETANKNSNPLMPGDVVVVTGGARGVTAEVAVALAQRYEVNLLLLGRTPLSGPEPEWLTGVNDKAGIKKAILNNGGARQRPKDIEAAYQQVCAQREVLATIARIERLGVRVSYEALDVRDAAAVTEALARARASLGPVSGIIHGAGVLADRLIEDKTIEQFQQVYDTKVDGIRALLKAAVQDELKILVMFSSSSARFGRKGQLDYAMANEVLNKIAQRQQIRRPACRVLSANWGPWDGGMVTPQLKKLFQSEGLDVISLQAGTDYLMQELAQTGPVELVLLGSEVQAQNRSAPAGKVENNNLSLAFARRLTIEDYPVLKSHVMNGKAVLPLALIAEWLVHGAIHDNPGLSFIGINDLRVLKGVVLEPGEGIDLQIMTAPSRIKGDEDRITVELRSSHVVHARAQIVLGQSHTQAEQADPIKITENYPFADGEYYKNGQLFHGADLQGIASVQACSGQGIIGQAKAAPAPSKWMVQAVRSSWLADPLILDSAFQMMILWSFHNSGAACLPTMIGKYRQYRRGFPRDGARIKISIQDSNRHNATATVEFLDDDDKLIAHMEDYECVIDVSLNEAFKRNRLDELQT